MVRVSPRFVLLIALMLAAQACSESGGPRHGGRRGGENGYARERGSGGYGGVTRLSANDRFRLHLTEVQIALDLTPDQAPLWQAYEREVLALIAQDGADAQARPDASALARIDRRAQAARERAAAMQRLADDARKLYSSLDAGQRRTADRLLPGTLPAEELRLAEPPRE